MKQLKLLSKLKGAGNVTSEDIALYNVLDEISRNVDPENAVKKNEKKPQDYLLIQPSKFVQDLRVKEDNLYK